MLKGSRSYSVFSPNPAFNASKSAQLGVRRLSAGSVIPQVIWQQVAHLTEAFFADGDSSLFTKDYIAHAQLQNLFTPR